jgi:transcription elongation factor GreA
MLLDYQQKLSRHLKKYYNTIMKYLFTNEGFEKVKHELKEAQEKRPDAVATLARARAMGDLSENGFYKGARFELNELDRKIRHLSHLIKQGQVIQKPKSNETVQIGHTVILRRIS